MGLKLSSLAVVARDWRGMGVLAISRKANTSNPLQAEAKTILWAAQLASDQGWDRVCIESDSKICIDALQGHISYSSWWIQSCVSNLHSIFSSHPFWSFSWVKREANSASHHLVGWSLRNRSWEIFYCKSSIDCFVKACKADMLGVPPGFGV
jgi:ribonuclease HI